MHPQCPHRPTFCVNSNLLANHRSRFLGLNADLTQNWRIWAKTRSWNDASWCLRGWGGRCGRDGLRIGWRPDCTTSALAATDNSTHLPYPSQHHPRHTNEDGWMIKMECVCLDITATFMRKFWAAASLLFFVSTSPTHSALHMIHIFVAFFAHYSEFYFFFLPKCAFWRSKCWVIWVKQTSLALFSLFFPDTFLTIKSVTILASQWM